MAMKILRETLDDFEELTQKDTNNTEWRHDLAICNLQIGKILVEGGERTQAVLHFEIALPILEKLSAASPENLRIFKDLVTTRKNITNLARKNHLLKKTM